MNRQVDEFIGLGSCYTLLPAVDEREESMIDRYRNLLTCADGFVLIVDYEPQRASFGHHAATQDAAARRQASVLLGERRWVNEHRAIGNAHYLALVNLLVAGYSQFRQARRE